MLNKIVSIAILLVALPIEARTWTVIRKEQTAYGPSVFIDAGSRHGIKRDSRLCVINPDSETIVCASVAFLRPTVSSIKVDESLYAQIDIGALVRLDGQIEPEGVPEMWRRRLSLRQISPLAQTIVYRAPRFNTAARVDSRVDTWTSDVDVRSGAWGLAVTWESPLTELWAVSSGAFFSLNEKVEEQSQFGLIDNIYTITTRTQGGIYGLKFDIDRQLFRYGQIQIQAGSGFSLQRGLVELKSAYTSKTKQASIAHYKGALLLLAFDADLEFQVVFGDFYLIAASRWSWPIKTMNDTYEGSINFDNANLAEANFRVRALRAAVDLQTSKGRQLELGLAFAF